MPRSTRLNHTPLLTRPDYAFYYQEPTEYKRGPDGSMWYFGTGSPASEHPLNHVVPFEPCGFCGNPQAAVIAAHHHLHPFTGLEIYDYELACEACGHFTMVSFASGNVPGTGASDDTPASLPDLSSTPQPIQDDEPTHPRIIRPNTTDGS